MTSYRYDLDKLRVSFRKGGRVFLVGKTAQQVPLEDLPEFFKQYDDWRERQYFAPFWLTGKPIVEKTAASIAEMKEMMGQNERDARDVMALWEDS
jgi:hypothetical protein